MESRRGCVNSMFRAFLLLWAALTLMLILGSSPAMAAPKAKLIPFWQVSDEASTAAIEHGEWQRLLDKYLKKSNSTGVTLFDYKAVTDADLAKLIAYIDQLQATDARRYNKREQFAFWVNLYNAKTVELVTTAVQEKGIDSIKQIRSSFIWPGPWSMKVLTVAGKQLSLNDIEHGILRPIWQDHRIHFVVNCASVGCPNLSQTAFTAANQTKLLAAAEVEFINHSRAVSQSEGKLVLSKIFDWYQTDFASDKQGLIEYLNSVRKGGALSSDQRVSYQYDWGLNIAQP